MGQHDSAYKLLFSYPHLVESLIRGFVPGDWIDHLDFRSLETVSEAHPRDNLGVRYDDVIWRLGWRGSSSWVYVYLLLEMQSTNDPLMAVRVLDYEGGLYRKISKSPDTHRGDRLPIVLPVVLYRGQSPWTAATEIFDLIAPAPTEITPYLPHLRYLLLDANTFSADRLAGMRNPVACLLWLEASRGLDTTPIEKLDGLLAAPEHTDLRRACALWLTQSFLPSRLPGVTVNPVKKLEEVSPMIAENAIDWSMQWREEGRQEGRREGEAVILLRQLTRRFGRLSAGIEERIHGADAEQLLDWGERFVTASTLAEIFDGKPS